MDHVGLYGNLPAQADLDSGASRGNRQGTAAGGRDMGGDAGHSLGAGATGQGRAGGSAEASVPLSYRRRVAEYFQRIADETGGK